MYQQDVFPMRLYQRPVFSRLISEVIETLLLYTHLNLESETCKMLQSCELSARLSYEYFFLRQISPMSNAMQGRAISNLRRSSTLHCAQVT